MVKGMHCTAAQLFMQCKTGWLALLAHSKLRACWQASKWERKLHTLCDDKIAEVVPQKQSKNRQKQTNKQTQGVTTALWGIYARIYRHHFIHCWGRGQCNSSYHTTTGLAQISQYSAWLQSGRSREPNTQRLKNDWVMKVLLCPANDWTFAWLGWTRKLAVPSPVGDVKIASPSSTFVLNTLAPK